jgi:septation ring formation regulator EzrA
MTEAAQKISLNFRRVTGETIAGMGQATLGIVAAQPGATWQPTIAELKREINMTKTFLNDRDYKMQMVDKCERIEQLQKQGETLEDEIDEIKKKFTLGGIFSRRKQVAEREEEIKEISAELSVLKEEEQKMRKAHDAAFKRLEKMDEKLCDLEGRPPKPQRMEGFTL